MPDPKQPEASSADDVESWMRELARAPRVQPPGSQLSTGDVGVSREATVPSDEHLVVAPLPQNGAVLDGRYRLDGVLGSGGMGVVYTATQLTTGKQVAIKWMRARERDPDAQAKAAERFVREAKAAARIEHPNVVDVYDVGGDPLTPYLVMERLRGENLRSRLERQPLAWDEAVRLLAPVMQALGRAHAVGVVHRDLKPDNLFLTERPDGQHVLKVLDFGISRLTSYGDDLEISLTRTGAMIGTPVYMPLEQLRGEPDLDGRTDIYALGVVLYEALTGQRPYPARNPAEYGVLLASTQPLPLPSLRPDLRGGPESVVMRALARDRNDRFESMDAFREALLSARLTPARPGLSTRTLILSALALLALLTTGVLWAFGGSAPQATPELGPEPSAPQAQRLPAPTPPALSPPAPELRAQEPAAVELREPVLMPTEAQSEPEPAAAGSKRARAPRPKRPGEQGAATPAASTGTPAPAAESAPAPSEHPATMKSDEF